MPWADHQLSPEQTLPGEAHPTRRAGAGRVRSGFQPRFPPGSAGTFSAGVGGMPRANQPSLPGGEGGVPLLTTRRTRGDACAASSLTGSGLRRWPSRRCRVGSAAARSRGLADGIACRTSGGCAGGGQLRLRGEGPAADPVAAGDADGGIPRPKGPDASGAAVPYGQERGFENGCNAPHRPDSRRNLLRRNRMLWRQWEPGEELQGQKK
jgi:hypothetical protein